MTNIDIRLYNIPLETLTKFLEATAVYPHSNLSKVAEYTGLSTTTSRNAITTLVTLGLVEKDDKGKYTCRNISIQRGIKESSVKLVIKQALLNYAPFQLLCEGFAAGESKDDAVRKAGVILEIPPSQLIKFEILIRWGKELEILEKKEDDRWVLRPEYEPEQTDGLVLLTPSDMESEVKATLSVMRLLGNSIYQSLGETEKALLAEALFIWHSNPEKAFRNSGQAVEDFLRSVAINKGLGEEATKKNGPGQLGDLLLSYKIIHSHHKKLIDAATLGRTVQAHNRDRRTLKPWDKTDLGAMWFILGALITIRSTFEYIYKRRQII